MRRILHLLLKQLLLGMHIHRQMEIYRLILSMLSLLFPDFTPRKMLIKGKSSAQSMKLLLVQSVAHEAVSVKPAALVSSELQVIKKKNPVLQIKIALKAAQKEFADQSTIDKELASRDEQLEEKHFVPPQETEREITTRADFVPSYVQGT